MKIVVNKTKAKERKEEVINEILNIAKECANRGINSFTYHFKKEERRSFPGCDINIAIKKVSEGTVKCGRRSDYGSHVTYYIV